MKELTIEQKAKLYDEAIKVAKSKIKNDKDHVLYENDIIELFPELKENEGERIGRALVKYFTSSISNPDYEICGVPFKEVVNWLEKQSQTFTQKDVDDAYLKGVTNTKNEIEKQYEANYQIRKDIATFIFNYKGDIKDRAKWMDYLGIKVSFVEKQGEHKETLCDKCKKEQPSHSCQDITALGRCVLEKQGKQKLTPIFRIGDTIIAKDGTYIEKEPFYIDRIKDDCYWDGENTILVCNQDEFEIFKKKPAEWSPEDEIMQKAALEILMASPKLVASTILKESVIDWLKSLKDRVQLQPVQEWNGGDDAHIHSIITHLQDFIESHPNTTGADIQGENVAWLKSLRHQVTWKPSEAQMKWLHDAMESTQYEPRKQALISLYSDLMKLKEE